MHTISVLVIGVAWTFLSLSHFVRMEQLTTWLQIAAGVLVVATGAWMLRRHLRGHSHSHDHSHADDDIHAHSRGRQRADNKVHADGHGHSHGPDHRHDHSKRPGLLLLGISGGLTPSPAAFLVLATGLFLGRGAFALLLVITFGLGMAVVLFAVGLLAVAGSSLVTRSSRTSNALRMATRVTPVLAAVGVTVFGVGLVAVATVHLTSLAS
jgi:ABC-type nickel/cobalt efflux system permease component RcnA